MLNTLLNMTIRNPIFVFVVFTIIWFLPGIILRRVTEKRTSSKKAEEQAKAIAKLYPQERKD